jgi:hypothetical protein
LGIESVAMVLLIDNAEEFLFSHLEFHCRIYHHMNPALIQRVAIGIRGKTSKKGLDEKGDPEGLELPSKWILCNEP